jgi:hypothetical protein
VPRKPYGDVKFVLGRSACEDLAVNVAGDEPERLVEFLSRYPGDPAVNAFSRTSYEHFRDSNRALAGITGVASTRFSVKADGAEPELVEGE